MKTAQEKNTFAIRPLAVADVARVLELAARSPGAARWSPGDYERASCGNPDGWVATARPGLAAADPAGVVGFLIARRVAGEMEILNLAVEPAFRRRGVAGGLLEAALADGRSAGIRKVFLEVRVSNAGAIAFYERQGFAPAGRRPRYYSDPAEDALVLARPLV